MDEVFGNSSSETIMEADLSRVLATINQDIADLQYKQLSREHNQPTPANQCQQDQQKPQLQARTHQPPPPTTNMAHIVNQPLAQPYTTLPLSPPEPGPNGPLCPGNATAATPRNIVAHVPVITSVGKRQQEGGWPVPHPRCLQQVGNGGALRHTQSAVVGRVCNSQSPRPRALSTGATTHTQHQAALHHQYHSHQHLHHQIQSQQHLQQKLQPQQHLNQQMYSQQQLHQQTQYQQHFTQNGQKQEHKYVNLQTVHVHHQQKVEQVERQQEQQTTRPLSTYDNIVATSAKVPISSAPLPPPQSAPPILQTAKAVPHTVVSSTPLAVGAVPKYVNVPLPSNHSPAPSHMEVSKTSGASSSAPSTPRGGGAAAVGGTQRLHHSYIELWSGAREERDSLSDSECEELKRSFQEPQTPSHRPSPGYVEMSSPYIKSPQVASPFNGSVLADLATKLASYAGHQPRNIFCPFCPRYFGYEKSLGSHIHKLHREELNSMVESRCKNIQLQFCPICQAQFFNTSVLPKHLIDFHRASVIEILEKNSCIISNSLGIHCPFCTKRVPHGKTGEQVLLYHMQQLHLSDYEDMIKSKFRPYTGASHESLKSISSGDVSQLVHFQPGVTSTPGLSNKLGTMKLSTDARRSVEALNLDATWSSHGRSFKSPMPPPPMPSKNDPEQQQQPSQQEIKQEQQTEKQLLSSVSKGILRHQSGLNRKPSVKRELRFSVPPVTSEEVFVPESPEQSTPERSADQMQQQQQITFQHSQPQLHQDVNEDGSKRMIPIRIDSLSGADFMDLNEKAANHRKRRRLGLGLRSRKAFKKRDKENIGEREMSNLVTGASKIVEGGKRHTIEGPQVGKCEVVPTPATRTFRRPKPVAVPRVPELLPPTTRLEAVAETQLQDIQIPSSKEENESDASPFTNLKLYSPLRMFRCNSCRVKFCDNESLSGHIGSRHKGLLYLLRPQYGCGVCSAKFFENKYLVKHCLQHHTSLLEIRSPRKQKITIYRFTQE